MTRRSLGVGGLAAAALLGAWLLARRPDPPQPAHAPAEAAPAAPSPAVPSPRRRRAVARRPASATTTAPEARAEAPEPETIGAAPATPSMDAWGAAMTALVEACVGMRPSTVPGTGIRIATVLDERGLVAVGVDLFGEVADRPGVDDCLEDRAWALDWPAVAAEWGTATDLQLSGDALPPGDPPIPLPEPPPLVLRTQDLPPEERARVEEALRRASER